MTSRLVAIACCGVALIGACARPPGKPPVRSGRFASDVGELQQHGTVVLLGSTGDAQVAVSPSYQGRVMTSTTGGSDAPSFGWIGWAAVRSGARQPHMNVFGGEDRFWLGPEGGQYALYFKPGDPFDIDHWQVPEPIDWGAWDVASQSTNAVRVHKRFTAANYSAARFEVDVDRGVRLLDAREIESALGVGPGSLVRAVAFESSNTITNAGDRAWQPESGLVSIWILGMFNPSADTTIAIPISSGSDAAINDAYFGKVPPDRLAVKSDILFFRGDGALRSKIGVPPARALSLAGSYAPSSRLLTLVQYTKPADATRYVNSMWERQRDPYGGDVVNSYNDGPVAPGKPGLGPFYELETSSPALALAPGARYTHVHRTFHFVGAETDLDRIARATLKVGLADLRNAFAPGAR